MMCAGVLSCHQAGCVQCCMGRNGDEQTCRQYDGYNCECTPEVLAHKFSPSVNLQFMTACRPRQDQFATALRVT